MERKNLNLIKDDSMKFWEPFIQLHDEETFFTRHFFSVNVFQRVNNDVIYLVIGNTVNLIQNSITIFIDNTDGKETS